MVFYAAFNSISVISRRQLTLFMLSLTCNVAIFDLSVITFHILWKFKIYNFSLKGDVGHHQPLSQPSPPFKYSIAY